MADIIHQVCRILNYPQSEVWRTAYIYRFSFKWEHTPLPDVKLERLKFVMMVEIGKWIWTIIKVRNTKDYYIWATNLVQFVKYDWPISMQGMFHFIMQYSPDIPMFECWPNIYKLYKIYQKKYETISN